MPNKVTEVTYNIDAKEQQGEFTIPEKVRTALGIAEDDYPLLNLVIADATSGAVLIDEGLTFQLSEGPEIVDARITAILESHQHLQVTVSLAD